MAKITRAGRRELDRIDAARAKARNEVRKKREQARRDRRMAQLVRSGALPYPPFVMSYLSRKLGKPSTLIQADDVRGLFD